MEVFHTRRAARQLVSLEEYTSLQDLREAISRGAHLDVVPRAYRPNPSALPPGSSNPSRAPEPQTAQPVTSAAPASTSNDTVDFIDLTLGPRARVQPVPLSMRVSVDLGARVRTAIQREGLEGQQEITFNRDGSIQEHLRTLGILLL